MKRIIVISMAIALLVVSSLISIGVYDEFQVYFTGHLVDARVTNSKNSLGFLKFSFNGKIYDKRIGKSSYPSDVSSFKVGDTIKLKYLKGYEDDFLFPDENPLVWGLLGIATLVLCAMGLLYYAIFRKEEL